MAQDTVTAIWSKPHYACAQNDTMTNWLTAAVNKQPDFMALAQYESIDVNEATLVRFTRRIGTLYRENAYHNFHHAFSVTQFTAALYKQCVIDTTEIKTR
jgi:hypothetical protein